MKHAKYCECLRYTEREVECDVRGCHPMYFDRKNTPCTCFDECRKSNEATQKKRGVLPGHEGQFWCRGVSQYVNCKHVANVVYECDYLELKQAIESMHENKARTIVYLRELERDIENKTKEFYDVIKNGKRTFVNNMEPTP